MKPKEIGTHVYAIHKMVYVTSLTYQRGRRNEKRLLNVMGEEPVKSMQEQIQYAKNIKNTGTTSILCGI